MYVKKALDFGDLQRREAVGVYVDGVYRVSGI